MTDTNETIVERHRRELLDAVREALKKHKTVRDAANAVGMARQTFNDYCRANGLSTPAARRLRSLRKAIK